MAIHIFCSFKKNLRTFFLDTNCRCLLDCHLYFKFIFDVSCNDFFFKCHHISLVSWRCWIWHHEIFPLFSSFFFYSISDSYEIYFGCDMSYESIFFFFFCICYLQVPFIKLRNFPFTSRSLRVVMNACEFYKMFFMHPLL